jgi:hypothetical protein
VCRASVPEAFTDGHHRRPQATGPSHEKVRLCSGCHQNLERVVRMLLSDRKPEAEDAVTQMYRVPKQRFRLFELAKDAVRWHQLKKDGQLAPVSGKITITLPPRERAALTVLAREFRNPKTGRPMGVAAYIEQLVIGHVRTRLPGLKQTAGGGHRG